MRRILAVMVVAVTSLAITIDTSVSSVHALPPGFSDVTLPGSATNPLSSLTAITPIPDGRALILEKGGAVRVLLADGTLSATDALNLGATVCTDAEEGLLGAAIDPNFATNGFVYLYYSHNAGNCASRHRPVQPRVAIHDDGQHHQSGVRTRPPRQHEHSDGQSQRR